MKPVAWTDALLLEYAPMDEPHRVFVDLLGQVQSATDDQLVAAWESVLNHTIDHFGREDVWMRKTRFAAADNHILQHKVVLNVMREGLALARCGQTRPVREMADELGSWFAKHTQTLDAALALHMRGQGVRTGVRHGRRVVSTA